MAKVKISTSYGDITVRLYDETPAHRDNFLKLAKDGFYDGTIFHRVIRDFMIQGGDPDSKNAPKGKQLGCGDVGYTIPAEFDPSLFHKRGALSAARQGDEVNPERRSSGCQFYIVWGKTYSEGQIGQMERQMKMQAVKEEFYKLMQEHMSEIMKMRRSFDRKGLSELQDRLEAEANAAAALKGSFKMDEAQMAAYTTIGGTPFLDGQYTVFGEVEEGLDVVGKIQEVSTDRNDRPDDDIKMKVTIL